MGDSGRPVWFVGDLDDPWVAGIADALPDGTTRIGCAGEWPEALFADLPTSATVVLHRAILTPHDADRLARLRRERTAPPRVVLCVGPYARYVDVERCAGLVDVVLPEATARDTIARHVREGESARRTGPRPRVHVVSGNHELRLALADACEAAGYPAQPSADWPEAAGVALAVWDVPVLEVDWPGALARRSRLGPVVALLGFADRALVREARARGAAACLELPCDPVDLVDVLDRLSAGWSEGPHEVPPPPAGRRRTPRAVVDPGGGSYN